MPRTRPGIHNFQQEGFTLIELLVVIAIIAILAVVVVLVLNPAQLLAQSRDSNRISDMASLNSAVSLYQTDQSGVSGYSLGIPNSVYPSVYDPAATSTSGTNCGTMGLPAMPSGYSWHCAASSTYRNTVSTGWIPINFQAISAGAPFGSLPIDPTNNTSSRLFYTYTANGSQFEVTANMESTKYQPGGSNDQISGDGTPLATVYAKGTNLALEPLDYGDPSLVGYWPLNEGTGTTASDESGDNYGGTWGGTQAGSSTYYAPGKIQNWAGYFNGSNDYVTVGNPSALQITGPLTVSAWINPSSLGTWVRIVSNSWQSSSITGPFLMEETASSGVTCLLGNGGGSVNTGSNALTVGTWSNVACVYSGSSLTVYVNGVAMASSNFSGSLSYSNGYPWVIGAQMATSTPNAVFVGLINNVRIYNRALTGPQIAALYNGAK